MPIIIVVDANAIIQSPNLKAPEWVSLFEQRELWGVQFAVPEVALIEAVTVVRRNWSDVAAQVARPKVGDLGLSETQAAMVDQIKDQSESYGQRLRERLVEAGASIVPPPPIDYLDIVRRASEVRPPYGRGKDNRVKDGFRDTVIWHTLVSIAQDNPGAEVWLVSNNTADFGPKEDNWTGERTGSRDDCPILFHNELAAELATHGVADRVRYVTTLRLLEQYLAAQFAPISASDLDVRTGRLDASALAGELMFGLLGHKVSPEKAALPPQVLAAQVVGAAEKQDGWSFTEGALRGADGWTARFSVDTELTVETFDGHRGDIQTKLLRVAGDITVSAGDTLDALFVTSVEALPDDPMRSLWERSTPIDLSALLHRMGSTIDSAALAKRAAANINFDAYLQQAAENIDFGALARQAAENVDLSALARHAAENIDLDALARQASESGVFAEFGSGAEKASPATTQNSRPQQPDGPSEESAQDSEKQKPTLGKGTKEGAGRED